MLEPQRWVLRVTSASKDRATAFVRKHQFTIGAPISFDEQHGAITALEYVLGAIAADVLNGLRAEADRRRLQIDTAEAVVHGELNAPLAHIGVVGATGHPGVQRIEVRAFVGTVEE